MRSSATIGQNTGNDAGRGGRPRRSSRTCTTERPGQPVVEITEHDHEGVADRIEILEDLPHLETPFVDPQAEVGGEHVDDGAANIDGRGQGAAGFAALHRQIEAMHVDDAMPGEQRVAEAFRHGVTGRAQHALVRSSIVSVTGMRDSIATLAG